MRDLVTGRFIRPREVPPGEVPPREVPPGEVPSRNQNGIIAGEPVEN